MLVSWIPTAEDLRLFHEEHWYRIPLDVRITSSKEWRSPGWVAAFESTRASGHHQQVLRYARVLGIEEKSRSELFSSSAPGPKQSRRYLKLSLGETLELPKPLIPPRSRQRTPFIWTTIQKLLEAVDFNDLFNDSPVENSLWKDMKAEGIDAERQWPAHADGKNYILDFAVFCRKRNIDVEMDGDQHHSIPANSEYDSERDSALGRKGWAVQRILAYKYRKEPGGQIRRLCEAIEQYGGIEGSPRFIPTQSGVVKQLRLLEQRLPYDNNETESSL